MKNLEKTRALLNRARAQLTAKNIEDYVGPHDPGWGEYRKAMLSLLERGESCLDQSRYIDGK